MLGYWLPTLSSASRSLLQGTLVEINASVMSETFIIVKAKYITKGVCDEFFFVI